MFGARKKWRGPSLKQDSEKKGWTVDLGYQRCERQDCERVQYVAPLQKNKKSGRTPSAKRETGRRLRSGRGRIIFALLLEVAFFDLLHEGFAPEEVALEIGGELAGHDEELIVDHL